MHYLLSSLPELKIVYTKNVYYFVFLTTFKDFLISFLLLEKKQQLISLIDIKVKRYF